MREGDDMNGITYGIYACERDKHALLEEFEGGTTKEVDLKELKNRVVKLLPKQPEQLFVSGTFNDRYRMGLYVMKHSHLVDDAHVTNEFYVNHCCEQLIDSLYARG